MNHETESYILQNMSKYLDNRQMVKLKEVLQESIRQSDDSILEKSSQELLEMFLATKRLEGRSEKTLLLYRYNIQKLLDRNNKNVCVMNTDDIRDFLSYYQKESVISKASIDNKRRYLSSFFKWLEDEEYIFKSPVRRIHKIRTTISVKETYADEDLEKLRDNCEELRNLAIIEMLNSTGIRIGELINLDIKDVDFEERECVVLGKGDKERVVYFDAKTKLHLQKYLSSRTDNNPALFVTIRKPYHRIHTGGIEAMLKKVGNNSDVYHVHPHKFRRTLATSAIDKGMPIEQVQTLLGHEKMDTTLGYAMVKQSNVKISHKKYLS
jgi:site-specific recombinase XerD